MDGVLAVSAGLAQEIQDVADVHVDVIGNVIAPEFMSCELHATRDPVDLRLVAVGLLTDGKRFDVLLSAFAEAAKSLPTMSLVIVGDGPDRHSLEAHAERLGVREKVSFVGLGTREEIIGWFKWADAIVSSSTHESFGLAIAEALASGLPVVTTSSGGPEEFVDPDLGIIVPVEDVSSLARAIERLPRFIRQFQPSAARDRMGSRFGPELFLRKISALAEDSLSGPS
jgi:glycosyltransferase involved in cell wall biosynthesis